MLQLYIKPLTVLTQNLAVGSCLRHTDEADSLEVYTYFLFVACVSLVSLVEFHFHVETEIGSMEFVSHTGTVVSFLRKKYPATVSLTEITVHELTSTQLVV